MSLIQSLSKTYRSDLVFRSNCDQAALCHPFIQNGQVAGFCLSVPSMEGFTPTNSLSAVFYSLRSVLFHPTTDHSVLFSCVWDFYNKIQTIHTEQIGDFTFTYCSYRLFYRSFGQMSIVLTTFVGHFFRNNGWVFPKRSF